MPSTVQTQADRDRAIALLEHAFRNADDSGLRDVRLADIVQHFADYRAAVQSATLALVEPEPVARAMALVLRIAARESWQAHYGKRWEDEAAEIVNALAPSTEKALAADGIVLVPRDVAEKLALFASEWDRWQAKGSTSTERMVRFSYGRARIELADFRRVREAIAGAASAEVAA